MAEDAKVEKKEDGSLTLKLEVPRESLVRVMAEGVSTKLLGGAVEYIMRELTPEMTQTFVMGIMKDAFKSFSSWKVRECLDKAMAPMIEEYVKRPEVIAFIRQNVEKGINEAIGELPAKVKQTLLERAVDGMTKAWKDR